MPEINVKIVNLPQIRSAFRAAPASMTKNLNIAIKKGILFIAGESAKRTPVRTGNLRASHFRSESLEFRNLYGKLQPSPRYAVFVHEGSKPHIIEARNKKALYWPGAAHPVKRVFHPGSKANPFLARAVTASQNQVDKFFIEAVDSTLNDIALRSR